jgi:hypothetical protein
LIDGTAVEIHGAADDEILLLPSVWPHCERPQIDHCATIARSARIDPRPALASLPLWFSIDELRLHPFVD